MKEPPNIEMLEIKFAFKEWEEPAKKLANVVNEFLYDTFEERNLPRLFVACDKLYVPAYHLHADTLAMALAHTCNTVPSGLALFIWTSLTAIEGFDPSKFPG